MLNLFIKKNLLKRFKVRARLSINSFFGLEGGFPLHDVLEMLVDKAIQSREVVLIVDDFCLGVLIGSELHKVSGFLASEFDTRCLQVTLHFLDFDVPFSLGVQKSEGSEHCLRIIGFKLLLFQN